MAPSKDSWETADTASSKDSGQTKDTAPSEASWETEASASEGCSEHEAGTQPKDEEEAYTPVEFVFDEHLKTRGGQGTEPRGCDYHRANARQEPSRRPSVRLQARAFYCVIDLSATRRTSAECARRRSGTQPPSARSD